jgi:hypothetical protein
MHWCDASTFLPQSDGGMLASIPLLLGKGLLDLLHASARFVAKTVGYVHLYSCIAFFVEHSGMMLLCKKGRMFCLASCL